ncbi:MAG: flavin reductase family protein [Spirochaetales bacterium]|nr:flavin reductase family protein [Spirochaetales bacterium]
MKKKKLPPRAWLYPEPAVLVGAMVDGKPNFITIGYAGVVAAEPPSIAVALRPHRYTFIGIQAHNRFSLNIPSAEMVKQTDYAGVFSGKEVDKSMLFGVYFDNDEHIPLIKEAPLSHACSVRQYIDLGSHILVVGEIMDTYINEDCFIDGKLIPDKIDPIIYAGGAKRYYGLGRNLGPAFIAKKIPGEDVSRKIESGTKRV